MSLTGDPLTDRLVPVASRLVGAIRTNDIAEVDAALKEARAYVADESVDGAEALCVVLAAMVPWSVAPSDLVAWLKNQAAFNVMVEAGVPSAVAAELISQKWDAR